VKGRINGGIIAVDIDNGFEFADTGQPPVGLGMQGEIFTIGQGILPVTGYGVIAFLPLEPGSPVNHRAAIGGVRADGMGGKAGKRQE